jgi:membrane protein DedA with SNARE-associated domain
MAVYWVGLRGGRVLFRWGRLPWLNPDSLGRVEIGFRQYGTWLLALNRFLPGVRALIFLFSGLARLPAGWVCLLGLASIAVWNGFLLALGLTIGQEAESLLTRLFLVTGGLMLLSLAGWFLKKKLGL